MMPFISESPLLVDNGINELPCNLVNNFSNTWEQCNFILQNECIEEDRLDYVYFTYCIMGTKLKYISLMIIISLLLVFFLTLSTIADEFLCPSLLTIAKNLGMSENLAGITLLAFGNGSSDIFSSLAAASNGKSELIVSELLGAGIFCLSIVAGLIFIKHDFRLAYRPLLRDTIFYLFAVYFTWFVCWEQRITLYYALGFILIYIIYLTVAVGGQAIYLRLQRRKRLRLQASIDSKLPTVSVKVDRCNSSSNEDVFNDSMRQESDWSHGSDWFVQSHDTMKRRRLSRSKLMTQEERSLLQNSIGQLAGPKYGGINNHVTNIKIEYNNDNIGKHENNDFIASLKNSNQKKSKAASGLDMKLTTNSNSKQDKLEPLNTTEVSLPYSGYVNPTFDENAVEQLENLNKKLDYDISKTNISGNNSNSKHNSEINIINEDDVAHDLKPSDNNTDQNLNNMMVTFPQKKTSYGNAFISTEDDSFDDDQNSISLNDWDDLFAHINPIYIGDWSDANLIRKIITILRSPLVFIALCTIPVVDHDKKRNNWCRLLNIFHCISIPVVIFISRKLSSSGSPEPAQASDGIDLGSIALQYHPILLLAIGVVLAIFMLKTTQSEKPPKYHVLFAYAGFVMSILWVYTLVTEILGILKAIGIAFSMSDTTIGLAFLAWGNSLGDIVANLALAEAGYPRMAIGACIGAPLLNLLIGFGLSFAINLGPSEVANIEYTPTITLLCLSLGIVILSLMLCTLVPPNYSKRPFGYVLISAYFVYIVLAFLMENSIITFD